MHEQKRLAFSDNRHSADDSGMGSSGIFTGKALEGILMANSVPRSGRAVPMRNERTGAAWLVSFDYREGTYWHEPQGNLRHIRRPYASRSIEPNLVPAGTH